MESQNKHTRYDLIQMQSMPLEVKVEMTKRRIKEWYDYYDGDVFVSFSGGKDSTVLKHIVDSEYTDVTSMFVNTGLEFPEIQRFVKDIKDGKYDCFSSNVDIIRPRMRFDEVIKTFGYPVINKEVAKTIRYAKRGSAWAINYCNGMSADGSKPEEYKKKYKRWNKLIDAPFEVSDKCCYELKESPAEHYKSQTKKMPILGILASESQRRTSSWIKAGCNSFSKKHPRSMPMSFWTEQDILKYIKVYDVPYAYDIYGDIVEDDNGKLKTTRRDRTGCMFCMFGVHLEKNPNRFQLMKQTHPAQYNYCMRPTTAENGGLGMQAVLDYLGVDYE